jgi:hypothetical protein
VLRRRSRFRSPFTALLALLFVLCIASGAAASPAAAEGTTYVVGTYDGKNLGLYIDGRRVTARKSNVAAGKPGQAEIGTFLAGDVWHGTLDDVALYNRALSPAVIKAHYAAGVRGSATAYAKLVGRTPALLSFWPLGDVKAGKANAPAADTAGRNPGVYRKGDYRPARSLIRGDRTGGLELNGVNGGVLIPTVTGVNPKDGFTLEAWVRAQDKRDATIFTTVGSGFLKTNGAGQFGFGVASGPKLDSVFSKQTSSTKAPAPTKTTPQPATTSPAPSGGGGGGGGGSSGIWIIPVGLLILVGLGFAVRELLRPQGKDTPTGTADEDAAGGE